MMRRQRRRRIVHARARQTPVRRQFGVPISQLKVEHFYRDICLRQIYEGASQIQQIVIARIALARHANMKSVGRTAGAPS